MGKLSVYNSEGSQIHPLGEEGIESRYSGYFGNVYFRAEFGGDRPYLESYVHVETERRQEQVYVEYVADEGEDLFAACRASVREELVDGRGWRIGDRTQDKPSKLFLSLVWNREDPACPSFAGTPLADHEATVEALLESGDEQLEIYGRNFAILAGLVQRYSDVDCSVVVAERSVNASADLVLAKTAMVQEIEVPASTVETIERYERRRERQRRQEQFSRVEDALADLADSDADPQTVANELQRRVARHFRGVEVSGPHTGRRRGSGPAPRTGDPVRTDGFSEYDAGPSDETTASEPTATGSRGGLVRDRTSGVWEWIRRHRRRLALAGLLVIIVGLGLAIGVSGELDSVWRLLRGLPVVGAGYVATRPDDGPLDDTAAEDQRVNNASGTAGRLGSLYEQPNRSNHDR